jgi:hypothetical protein
VIVSLMGTIIVYKWLLQSTSNGRDGVRTTTMSGTAGDQRGDWKEYLQ